MNRLTEHEVASAKAKLDEFRKVPGHYKSELWLYVSLKDVTEKCNPRIVGSTYSIDSIGQGFCRRFHWSESEHGIKKDEHRVTLGYRTFFPMIRIANDLLEMGVRIQLRTGQQYGPDEATLVDKWDDMPKEV